MDIDPMESASAAAEDDAPAGPERARSLALQHGALGTQVGDASRLDIDRFAGAAGAVDDASDFLAMANSSAIS